tara:strand:- start:1358 stop:1633 length:276 start_codon:yes stop_codon:yes gene_type:complete
MAKEKEWYSYEELTTAPMYVLLGRSIRDININDDTILAIRWKIHIEDYLKNQKGWKSCNPKDFEYKLKTVDNHKEISEVRNVTLLKDIFTL